MYVQWTVVETMHHLAKLRALKHSYPHQNTFISSKFPSCNHSRDWLIQYLCELMPTLQLKLCVIIMRNSKS